MPNDKRRIIIIVATALMCVLATVGLTVFAFSFLPVTKVELSGVTDFDKAEIVKLSGIKMGAMTGLPYIRQEDPSAFPV